MRINRLFIVLSLLLFTALFSMGQTVNIGELSYSLNSSGTAEVYSGYGVKGNLVIPDEIEYEGRKYTVDKIGSNAFKNCYGLNSVSIPGSVTYIESYAFEGCSTLTSVRFEDSDIWNGSKEYVRCRSIIFKECPLETIYVGRYFTDQNPLISIRTLKSVEISDNITEIQNGLFSGNEYLKEVKYGKIAKIGANAFSGCKSLEVFPITPDITYIGAGAFMDCILPYDFVIPDSDTPLTVGKNIFRDDSSSNVETVYLGRTINVELAKGEYTSYPPFRRSGSLKSVTVGPKVTRLPNDSFDNCHNLEKVELSEGLITIGISAFAGTEKLRSIVIPQSVDTIGSWAFNCSGLDAIDIPNARCLGERAFRECPNLKKVKLSDYISAIWDEAFELCTELSEVNIPMNAHTIGKYAFYRCPLINSIEIPGSVNYIGERAFMSLEEVSFLPSEEPLEFGNNPFGEYSRIKNLYLSRTFRQNGKEYLPFKGSPYLENLTLGPTINEIDSRMFERCPLLAKVVIPAETSILGSMVFSDCSSLKEVIIEDSENKLGVNSGVFYRCPVEKYHMGRDVSWKITEDFCSTLKEVTIGEYVTEIKDDEFSGCPELTSIFIPKGVKKIGMDVFSDCPKLDDVKIESGPDPLYFPWRGAFSGSSVKYLFLGRDIETGYSGFGPFGNNKTMCSIVIGDEVTDIPDGCFQDNSKVTSLTLGKSVKTIGTFAFQYCNISEVFIPASTVRIDLRAFGETDLRSIVFEDGKLPLMIHEMAFANFETKEAETLYIGRDISLIPYIEGDGPGPEEAFSLLPWSSVKDVVYGDLVSIVPLSLPRRVLNATIGSGVLSVYSDAFTCWTLNNLKVKAKTPPSVFESSFDESNYSNTELVVPEESLDAYKSHSVWGKFENISGLDFGTSEPPETPVVTISPSSLMLHINTGAKLTAKVSPLGSNQKVAWSSSDPTIATVSDDGYVTAIVPGKASITATAQNGATASCPVIVLDESQIVTIESDGLFYDVDYTTGEAQLVHDITYNYYPERYTRVIIPETVKAGDMEFKVTSIKSVALSADWDLEILSIPPTVTTIGDGACSHIKHIGVLEFRDSEQSLNVVRYFTIDPVVVDSMYVGRNITFANGYRLHKVLDCLKSVVFSKSVTAISPNFLYGSGQLTNVKIEGPITEIPYRFCFGCSSLKTIRIPSTVTSIGGEAFYDVPLDSIYVAATVPPAASYGTFIQSVFGNCTLYVPKGCRDAYASAEIWRDFYKIEEFDGLDVGDIRTSDGEIDWSAPYEVYDTGGLRVADSLDRLTDGIYIVIQKDVIRKIAIKGGV